MIEYRRKDLIMKKTIYHHEYDTDHAQLIKQKCVGSFGEPAGYEERLYRDPNGLYFLYVNGGERSPYHGENIKCVSKMKAEEWLNAH